MEDKCKDCGIEYNLTKHHNPPKRLKMESKTVTLCRICHDKKHPENFGYEFIARVS